jgi:hypothetical protein
MKILHSNPGVQQKSDDTGMRRQVLGLEDIPSDARDLHQPFVVVSENSLTTHTHL